jgi:2-dehydro-3-deoxygluconokinase
MTNKKIVGYGELMLRLSPLEHGTLMEQTNNLKMGFAGAEANILADMALLGHSTVFVSAFPQNPVGRAALLFLQRFGINTQSIFWNQERLGTYFIEHGTSVRATRVTYDRKQSSVSTTVISKVGWETILDGASYFVLTGITPALSKICRYNIETALEIAEKKKVKIAFDLNYRRTLWSTHEARESFETILQKVDILFANIGAAADVFDIAPPPIKSYVDLKHATEQAAHQLNKLGQFEYLAMTLRLQQSANNNMLGGMILKEEESLFSRPISTEIIDRLGGGDAFAAALLHGLIRKWPLDKTINFAGAAFAATQTITGDINYLTEQELLAMASGDLQGFVKR